MRGVAGRFSRYPPGGRRLSPQIQALRRTFQGRVAAPENEAVRDNGAVFWLQLPPLRRLFTQKHNIWG